jgi:hypothetical protein
LPWCVEARRTGKTGRRFDVKFSVYPMCCLQQAFTQRFLPLLVNTLPDDVARLTAEEVYVIYGIWHCQIQL